jgi:hypothetical protein
MKNITLKTCLTALALSIAGSANAQAINQSDFTHQQLPTYSAISGSTLSVSGQPPLSGNNIGGHLAAQAAVAIGAYSEVKDVYAGAAAGVGASAKAENISAGAAAVIGTRAKVGHITAGAAITLGADARVQYITDLQSATITYGAGADNAGVELNGPEYGVGIQSNEDMAMAMGIINQKFDDIDAAMNNGIPRTFNITNNTVWFGVGHPILASAINLTVGTVLTVVGHVTVITTEAMTLGAGSMIELADDASVTWILGGALNLGANSVFNGTAYVRGGVNGATSEVGCGNLYATGAISIGKIGASCNLAPQRDENDRVK